MISNKEKSKGASLKGKKKREQVRKFHLQTSEVEEWPMRASGGLLPEDRAKGGGDETRLKKRGLYR